MALDLATGMAVFRQAIERGSLAAAGRSLGLSAEMAGRHLRALERQLGARLLNRSTRRLDLTPAGERYYHRCVAILDEMRLAEAEAKAETARPFGRLRIAAPLAFGSSVLARPIADFSRRHPDVRLELTFSERTVDLLAEGFDMALRLGQLVDSDLVARHLADYRLLLVAAPGFAADRCAVARPAELPLADALVYGQTTTPDRWTFTDRDSRRETVQLRGRIQSSDVAFLVELAVAGAGLALLPEFTIRRELSQQLLVEVLPDWRERDLPLQVLLPHRTLVPAAVRVMVEHLARCLRHAGELQPARSAP